jgi:hypothetical protein
MPVFDVRSIPTCSDFGSPCGAPMLAVTVQIPFGIPVVCPLCLTPPLPPAIITVNVHGVASPAIGVQPLADQVHFFTQCDIIVPGSVAGFSNGGLPCAPVVTHADGTPVNASKPAKSGEELVAYATGLGETVPAVINGKPVIAALPTRTVFSIDFNYRPNALATKPGPLLLGIPSPVAPAGGPAVAFGTSPSFTGATAGFVGLYQINFIVPPAPAGLPPCADPATVIAFANVVQSNLTVSVGSNFSFDGAGICVQP